MFIVIIVTARNVSAQSVPTFPSCLQPQGTLIAQHVSGPHGVPGDLNTYNGIDTVYKLTNDTYVQCLCAGNGVGIQSNWWNVRNLSEQQINSLTRSGWKSIPNGYAWGLTEGGYLAQNTQYNCPGDVGGVRGTKTRIGGQVLGLATTGSLPMIVLSAGIGIVLLLLGGIFRKNSKTI